MERSFLDDSSMNNHTQDLLATYYGIGRQPEDSLIKSTDKARGNLKKSEESNEALNGYQEITENDTKDSFEDDAINSICLLSDTELDKRHEDIEINTEIDKTDNKQDRGNDKEIIEEDNMFSHHLQSDEKNVSTAEVNVGELPVNSSDVLMFPTKRKSRKSMRSRALPLPALPKRSAIWNETFVDLTSSGLSEFPAEILDKYSGLRMLYLASNDLTGLPEELFTCLQRLEWLDARDNHLTSFPKSVKSHPCLETLLLQGNKLEELPLEIGLVPKLRSIQVAGNPLQVPPKVVVDLGTSAILDFSRTEWNKIHPEDPVEPNKKDLKDSSTLICYRTPRCKKSSILSGKMSKARSSIVLGEIWKRGSTGKRYKPSNRYSIPGSNFSLINVESVEKSPTHLSARNFLTSNSARNSHEIKLSIDHGESTKSPETLEGRSTNTWSDIEPEEEIISNESAIDEINKKIQRLSGPNGPFRRTKNIRVGTVNNEDEGSCRVQLPSIDLARLDSARRKDARRTSCDFEDEERTFEIVTNDRKKFRVRPLRMKNPDLLLSLLEKCVGVKK